eukprot:TRINITY_DN51745_c0_g1_i3.p2 TRINITY_DN51745_c0_g1~~TRINITY_DN51745_c0_g1_i3.p2  ORF type:complete len:336 (-),score=80.02 TRINITY_DN51745_c0_g1_i3:640-1647(-)
MFRRVASHWVLLPVFRLLRAPLPLSALLTSLCSGEVPELTSLPSGEVPVHKYKSLPSGEVRVQVIKSQPSGEVPVQHLRSLPSGEVGVRVQVAWPSGGVRVHSIKMQFSMPTSKSAGGGGGYAAKRQQQKPTLTKRHRPEGSEETDIKGEDDETDVLQARILALERMVATHDDALRALDGYTMTTWVVPNDEETAKLLWDAQAKYNEMKPQRGPHPWGPARRPLGKALVEKILTDKNALPMIPQDHEWRRKHTAFTKPEEVDALSIDYLQIKETREGKTLIRMRPKMMMLSAWQVPFEFLTKKFSGSGGEAKTEGPPPGPIIREIKNNIRLFKQQ